MSHCRRMSKVLEVQVYSGIQDTFHGKAELSQVNVRIRKARIPGAIPDPHWLCHETLVPYGC